jgi:cytoskeletal protein CcmA (bactofilin family)
MATETSDGVNAASQPPPANQPSPDAFDPNVHFDQWLQDIQPTLKMPAPETLEVAEVEDSGIYIGSFPGSNCEVSFDGVLHFDGYSIGNISSPQGTLVLTKRGRIEADIDVAVAVIGGSVTGNITASERVVLDSDARVTGLIRTRALSVRLGAIFDGDCIFINGEDPEPLDSIDYERSEEQEALEYFAVGAGV